MTLGAPLGGRTGSVGFFYGQSRAAHAGDLQDMLDVAVRQYQDLQKRLGLDHFVEF